MGQLHLQRGPSSGTSGSYFGPFWLLFWGASGSYFGPFWLLFWALLALMLGPSWLLFWGPPGSYSAALLALIFWAVLALILGGPFGFHMGALLANLSGLLWF